MPHCNRPPNGPDRGTTFPQRPWQRTLKRTPLTTRRRPFGANLWQILCGKRSFVVCTSVVSGARNVTEAVRMPATRALEMNEELSVEQFCVHTRTHMHGESEYVNKVRTANDSLYIIVYNSIYHIYWMFHMLTYNRGIAFVVITHFLRFVWLFFVRAVIKPTPTNTTRSRSDANARKCNCSNTIN